MEQIKITNNNVCAYVETDGARPYVFYTGGIAGVSDRITLERDTERLDRRADEVKLER